MAHWDMGDWETGLDVLHPGRGRVRESKGVCMCCNNTGKLVIAVCLPADAQHSQQFKQQCLQNTMHAMVGFLKPLAPDSSDLNKNICSFLKVVTLNTMTYFFSDLAWLKVSHPIIISSLHCNSTTCITCYNFREHHINPVIVVSASLSKAKTGTAKSKREAQVKWWKCLDLPHSATQRAQKTQLKKKK